MINLKGKIAIVTGAARGIGQAIAVELARYGASVVVSDIIPGQTTVNKIKAIKGKAIYVKTDVSNKKQIENLVQETVKKFKKIDILVNNAGVFHPSPSEALSEEHWDRTIDINLKGYFLCAQAAGKHMIKKRKGSIINIASVAGLEGYAGAAAYCSSKGGIVNLTHSLAAEWGPKGIRVNSICPGVIETPMTEGLLKDPKTKQAMLGKIPLKRTGKPIDIAGAVVFLASDAASYVTSEEIIIDGGWMHSL